jgi:predicted RecA/RadA family phage recombinase
MTATALNLRSPVFKSFKVTAPSAGYTAGQMVKIEDTVGVIVETKTVGLETALIYECEKIVVPKSTGVTFAIGDKVYFDATAAAITSVASDGTLCGRANVAALTGDTSVEITLMGEVAA